MLDGKGTENGEEMSPADVRADDLPLLVCLAVREVGKEICCLHSAIIKPEYGFVHLSEGNVYSWFP